MTSVLRVLHVLGELRPSGAESMLLAAAPEFLKHGVIADIVSTGNDPGPFSPQLGAAGYRIHHIPFLKSFDFFLSLRRLIRGRYDVVHIHMERACFWVALTAISSGAPVVVRTIHSSFSFSGNLRVRRRIQRRILRWTGVRQIAVGRSVQETEASCFGARTEVILNWYDSKRFTVPDVSMRRCARMALDIGEHDLVITSVGNCAPVKNHVAFIEALAAIPANMRPLYLHVGIEEPGCPEREWAQKLRVHGRIRFLGHLTDVRSVLYASDAFVIPSIREGCGIAAIEAMAVGLPIIATDVPGLRDFREQFNGIIYATPEADSLSDALVKLIGLTTEERRELSRDYPLVARHSYGIETGVKKYLNVYLKTKNALPRSANARA